MLLPIFLTIYQGTMKSYLTQENLYAIEREYQGLFQELSASDEGSYTLTTEDIQAKLNEQYSNEVDGLAINVINHLNNCNKELASYKAELDRVKDRIAKRMQVIQNEVNRFDQVLAHILRIKGSKSINYPNGSITSRKTTSLNVGKKGSDEYDAIAAILPNEFVTAETSTAYTIDGSAIKKAVKSNDATLPENFHRLVVEKVSFKVK